MRTTRIVCFALLLCLVLPIGSAEQIPEPEYIVPTFRKLTSAICAYLNSNGFDGDILQASIDAMERSDYGNYLYFGSGYDHAMYLNLTISTANFVGYASVSLSEKHVKTHYDEFKATTDAILLNFNVQYTADYIEEVKSILRYYDVIDADIAMETSYSDGYLKYTVSRASNGDLSFSVDFAF